MQFFNWWRFIRPYLPCTIIIIILWSSWLIWFFEYFWYLFSPIECRLSLHSQYQMICVRVSGRIEIWKYPAAIYLPPPKIAMRKILYLIQRRWWWWCCIFLELPKYMNFIRKMFQIVMLFLFLSLVGPSIRLYTSFSLFHTTSFGPTFISWSGVREKLIANH